MGTVIPRRQEVFEQLLDFGPVPARGADVLPGQEDGEWSRWFYLAMAYERLGATGKAKEWYARAVEFSTYDTPGWQEGIRRRYLRQQAEALLGK